MQKSRYVNSRVQRVAEVCFCALGLMNLAKYLSIEFDHILVIIYIKITDITNFQFNYANYILSNTIYLTFLILFTIILISKKTLINSFVIGKYNLLIPSFFLAACTLCITIIVNMISSFLFKINYANVIEPITISSCIFTVLFAGLEELIFRVWMFKKIRSENNAIFSIIIVSLVFSIMHISTPLGLWKPIAIFPISVAYTYFYEKYNSIYPSFISHATVNLLSVPLTQLIFKYFIL